MRRSKLYEKIGGIQITGRLSQSENSKNQRSVKTQGGVVVWSGYII